MTKNHYNALCQSFGSPKTEPEAVLGDRTCMRHALRINTCGGERSRTGQRARSGCALMQPHK